MRLQLLAETDDAFLRHGPAHQWQREFHPPLHWGMLPAHGSNGLPIPERPNRSDRHFYGCLQSLRRRQMFQNSLRWLPDIRLGKTVYIVFSLLSFLSIFVEWPTYELENSAMSLLSTIYLPLLYTCLGKMASNIFEKYKKFYWHDDMKERNIVSHIQPSTKNSYFPPLTFRKKRV